MVVRNNMTGRFQRKFTKNQRVTWNGQVWRVCEGTHTDSRSSHLFYRLQRGNKVESVRGDYIRA